MTTFGWKRKIGASLSKQASEAFLDSAKDENEVSKNSNDINWLSSFKKKKLALSENCETKSIKLKSEGEILAENERYWEAIKIWDEAIQLTPANEKLYEMKAQALMQLNEVFPAVRAAEKAVHANPQWWVAFQTLGRAQLGIGELKLAIKSFSKAIHINPAETELWENDLQWALELLKKQEDSESKDLEGNIMKDVISLNEEKTVKME